jgi:hypothetical protein
MKERANAILVFLIGLLLVVYWMWPAADQLIGALLRKGGQAGQRQQACSHDAKKALQEKVVHSHRV